ncbi:hypothetical protein HS088_TW13G00319 [Tripterygium wilfordii]|uniref:Uncharacterized protein n=1 Tax=Tripterygium wilfordii TaxID=458696 RepID=A0A7J7CU05_TRIWF|nr:uncharacterized protein LOC120013077 [Tripterygium wilfordii]KAF5737439.1 hypothetical protein HS088_TW13G00319 [Tripterygium wilfordii]
MSSEDTNPETTEPTARAVGGTEYSWCKSVVTGTGITVLTLLFSKPPDFPFLETALHYLQNSHPILRSKLRFDPTTKNFSFATPSAATHKEIQQFDLSSTNEILENLSGFDAHIPPHHLILEHELNRNTWLNPNHPLESESDLDHDFDLFFASAYTLSDTQWSLVLRLHTSVCDRSSAVTLLRELMKLSGGGDRGIQKEYESEGKVSLGIEDYIPNGKDRKPFWARGMDLLGYSLNSFRLANLEFVDANSPRYTKMVRLQMNPDDTERLVAGCKSSGIKLCGALAAAGLMAARSTKDLLEHQMEKYGVVTLMDCRSLLDPILNCNHIGFYHSAIMNSHDISGEEKFWDAAKRCYTAFENAKNNNKHFTDMADLNFLMCKAIENPGITPSSALRTAFLTVFEETVIDESSKQHGKIGLEDYIGCSSVHGVGPSIAIFDTIRDGRLDCACVYPSPLHSREQMQKLIDDMKTILVKGCNTIDCMET